MKRVLVTGATGFIGRACLAPLHDRGFEVHAIAHGKPAGDEKAIWHRCDLLEDPTSVVSLVAPTHLLHLAWHTVPGGYWTARENLSWLRTSLALYQAFAGNGGTRVVMGGSCAEYSWDAGICDERTTPIEPRTYYGKCKAALQSVVAADAAVAGISGAWARFFFLYGPHEHPQRLVSSVIRSLLRGVPAPCSPGNQRRDFLHVTDAASATVALLDSPVVGPVNIASGTSVTVRALVERLAQLAGGTIALGALPADPDPLVCAAVDRLRNEVGFREAVDADQRLHETISWWRQLAARESASPVE